MLRSLFHIWYPYVAPVVVSIPLKWTRRLPCLILKQSEKQGFEIYILWNAKTICDWKVQGLMGIGIMQIDRGAHLKTLAYSHIRNVGSEQSARPCLSASTIQFRVFGMAATSRSGSGVAWTSFSGTPSAVTNKRIISNCLVASVQVSTDLDQFSVTQQISYKASCTSEICG